MNSDLKIIPDRLTMLNQGYPEGVYLNTLIDNFINHYNLLMIELNKINKYVDINDPRRLQSKLGRPLGEKELI